MKNEKLKRAVARFFALLVIFVYEQIYIRHRTYNRDIACPCFERSARIRPRQDLSCKRYPHIPRRSQNIHSFRKDS